MGWIYIFEGLINQLKKENTNYSKDLLDISSKLDKIEKVIQRIFPEESTNGKIIIDLSNIKNNFDISDLVKYQDLLDENIEQVIINLDSEYNDKRRGYFLERVNIENVTIWLDSLNDVLKKYIWSKTIAFNIVFQTFKCTQYEVDQQIPYKALYEINQLYLNIPENQKTSFAESIVVKLTVLENDNQINAMDEAAAIEETLA